ncbi:MAG: hypothetical protein LJE83_10315, partial [Gammaproteobacteria bacterium]|nr:hypothetical protein [Gammaproteobacteria bacterium]
IFGSIKIYGRLDVLRQHNYKVALFVAHKDSDDVWSFYMNINNEIPVVLGQLIDVKPNGIRVDRLLTNQDQSTTIQYDIEFDDLQRAYSYMADLLYYGHWEFSPILDQKLPEEVKRLVKEHM